MRTECEGASRDTSEAELPDAWAYPPFGASNNSHLFFDATVHSVGENKSKRFDLTFIYCQRHFSK
jgi:hypothetical protein